MNILQFTNQAPLLGPVPPTGGSLRTWSIARMLSRLGHNVTISLDRTIIETYPQIPGKWQERSHSTTDLASVIQHTHPDMVIVPNWGYVHWLPHLENIPLVVDAPGPLVLENYFRNHSFLKQDSLRKIRAFAAADLILCSSQKQAAYYKAWCLAGGLRPDAPHIAVAPISLPDFCPIGRRSEEPRLVFSGYQWPWLENERYMRLGIDALGALDRGSVHVYSSPGVYVDSFIGEDSSNDAHAALELPHSQRLIVHEPMLFSDLVEELAQGWAALDLFVENDERELAFPTRSIVHLWCGVPVITLSSCELSNLIREYKAGWVLDPSSVEQELPALIAHIAANPDAVLERSKNAQHLVRVCLSWSATEDRLKNILPPKKTYVRKSPITAMEEELISAQHHVDQLITEKEKLEHDRENRRQEAYVLSLVHRKPKGLAWLQDLLLRKHLLNHYLKLPWLCFLTAVYTATMATIHIMDRWQRLKQCLLKALSLNNSAIEK